MAPEQCPLLSGLAVSVACAGGFLLVSWTSWGPSVLLLGRRPISSTVPGRRRVWTCACQEEGGVGGWGLLPAQGLRPARCLARAHVLTVSSLVPKQMLPKCVISSLRRAAAEAASHGQVWCPLASDGRPASRWLPWSAGVWRGSSAKHVAA